MSGDEKVPAEQIYLIQDTRSYLGDSVMWWRPEGKGYTARFDHAGRYSEAEAKRIARDRSTDVAIPLEVATEAASRHVMAGDLRKALDAAKVPR